jgi:phage-related minor tail protein
MDDEIDRLLAGMRADASQVGREVAALQAAFDGPLAVGAARAGAAIESSLLRAVRNGKLGFEDLRRSALSVMDAIAASALRGGVDGVLGGGLGGALALLVGGAPGRATGGAVSPGRPYWVGERGPELMVPASAGSVVPMGSAAREMRVAITVNAAADVAPAALRQSSRQVARAVRAALMEA